MLTGVIPHGLHGIQNNFRPLCYSNFRLIIEMPSLLQAASKENAPVSRELAAKMLSVSQVTIDWLLRRGELGALGANGEMIDAIALRHFHSQYVSAHEIAALLGMTTSAVLKEQWRNRVWAELFEIGHTPIFARKTVWLPHSLVAKSINAKCYGETREVCGETKIPHQQNQRLSAPPMRVIVAFHNSLRIATITRTLGHSFRIPQ